MAVPPNGKKAHQMSPQHRIEILRRWGAEQPRAGVEEHNWYETVAGDTGYSPAVVRRVVAEEASAAYAMLRDEVRTDAQKLADVVGATAVRALNVLSEAMDAEETQIVRDGHGNPVLDSMEQPVMLYRPLWGVRVKAAEILLNVHDGFAPKKIEMKAEVEVEVEATVEVTGTVTVDVATISDEELTARLLAVKKTAEERLHAISRVIGEAAGRIGAGAIAAGGAGGSGKAPHGADAPSLPEGSLVLADRVHSDQG